VYGLSFPCCVGAMTVKAQTSRPGEHGTTPSPHFQPDDLSPQELPDPRYPDKRHCFYRCGRCHVPVWKEEFQTHRAGCTGKGRRGRPRKYPIGYNPPRKYQHGGMRRGWRWSLEVFWEQIGRYGTLEYRGERLYPLAWIGAAIKKHPKTIWRQVKRERLPYILAPGPGRGIACVREAEAKYILDVVNFRARNAP